MGITNEQKRDILKRVFITGEGYSNLKEKDALSSEEKEYLHKQVKARGRYHSIKRQFGTSNVCGYGQFGQGVVYATLLTNVWSERSRLEKARIEANRAFKVYMEYKKLVKSGELSYADEKVRKNFNELKANWIKASQDVQARKSYLKQNEVLLNKFMEFMKLI